MTTAAQAGTPAIENPLKRLTPQQIEEIGAEFERIHDDVYADLGEHDANYIRSIIEFHRRLAALSRIVLMASRYWPAWVLGTTGLSVAKILENMEIGHNVMHGQYDWTRDPALDSRRYEWDIVCTGDDWRHSHNFEHHTFTNILGKDRDIGYAWLRVCPEQAWRPAHVAQPLVALGLAFAFEWGVGAHDLRVDELLGGKQSLGAFLRRARPFATKAAWQLGKDYAFYPALALANAPRVVAGNLAANVVRNLWAFSVIFCGHFPDGVAVFDEAEAAGESRGQWYERQLRGSANIEGGRWLHLMTGHLSHQIEHHLFPDLPAARYPEIAPRVRAICARYGLPYCTGGFARQLGSVARRLLRLSLPTRRRRRVAVG